MNKRAKALLISLFIFPGAGQIYLKRWLRALIFIIPATASLSFIALHTYHQAEEILEKALSGEIGLDSQSIQAAVAESASERETLYLKATSLLILLSWAGSGIDAAILGKKESSKNIKEGTP